MTWDEEMIYGCVCDSAWEVGLGSGQTQEPEWFGPDCSLRHCPSGDDPSTDEDETDCEGVTSSSVYTGTAASRLGTTLASNCTLLLLLCSWSAGSLRHLPEYRKHV